MAFDAHALRASFPLLRESDVVYLDSAATTQKPDVVLRAMNEFYATHNANVNRGVHRLAEAATIAYDDARVRTQQFLHARHAHEIIFTRNTTEAINLVARTWGDTLSKGDAVAVSLLEHHSNIIPWQQLQQRRGVDVRWIGLTPTGEIDLEDMERVLGDKRVKLVAVSAVSNVLGTIAPLRKIVDLAHEAGALVLVDAAQLAPHATIDVQELQCDFLAFSGHKIYGPTGIGVLYGKEEHLEVMPPFLGGGDMIQRVTTAGFTPAELPRKFEAGTPAIAEAVGLGAAMDWLRDIDMAAIASHERALLTRAIQRLSQIKGMRILGPQNPDRIASCVSFTVADIHPHDLTQLLSEQNIMLRAGHHCAEPLHLHLGIPASTRLSVALYTTTEDIERACDAVERTLTAWSR